MNDIEARKFALDLWIKCSGFLPSCRCDWDAVEAVAGYLLTGSIPQNADVVTEAIGVSAVNADDADPSQRRN